MESQPTPLRLPRLADRKGPDRTADRVALPSSGENHGRGDFSSPVLPVQNCAPVVEPPEMSWKSAEDISARIRQDGVRHLLMGRAAGNPACDSFGGNAFVLSLIVGASSIRTDHVR